MLKSPNISQIHLEIVPHHPPGERFTLSSSSSRRFNMALSRATLWAMMPPVPKGKNHGKPRWVLDPVGSCWILFMSRIFDERAYIDVHHIDYNRPMPLMDW